MLRNSEIMEFYCKVVLFFLIIATIILTKSAQATTPNISLIYDDTIFGYFIVSPINWPDAEVECNNWGGNLATIKSAEEDNLLFYSTQGPDTDYISCYIGLNDIDVEADTNASEFKWVDGSNSTYRNFDPNPGIPSPSDKFPNCDCVRFRYNNLAGVLSTGWINRRCELTRSCYFCNKVGNSQGCDLIYNGSCYRLFEVSTGINWLDAQSSCAIWGGDLTSITTERENNYLYTIIPDTVSNCWIGLNDRDGDGIYSWIDGSVYSHTNWTGSEPSFSNEDCVEIIRAGEGSWETVSCEITINTFLCKRPSSVTTAVGFGQLTNGGLDFGTISDNEFFFTSRTLAFGGEESNVIIWNFSENSDLSDIEVLTATYSNAETGWSWLAVDITKQGYYQCQVGSVTYTIGLYDNSLTTVATEGTPYVYIVGVDREDVLLLCDPVVSDDLSMLKWSLTGSGDFLNPINIYNERNTLPEQSTGINCVRDSSIIYSNFISLQVPELTIHIGSISASKFTAVCPAMNELAIPLSTQDITLSTNIVGKWTVLGLANPTRSNISIDNFMEGNAGLYEFYINNWDGVDVCAIQITLSSSPAITERNPEEEFILDDNTFGYFTISPVINWITAQLYCINWGGNLATIKSAEEDSLLFYSITDLDNAFSCFIGLNDIDVEAGTDASAFVWIDGSASTYRNFDSLIGINPGDSNAPWDCVRFRYRSAQEYYQQVGLIEVVKPVEVVISAVNQIIINETINYMQECNSQGCDLIYNGFCYRLFKVSTGINWLDAQSSCAVWGGDLTSITTERENNYLYTTIPDTVSNCWIGLNDRDGDGSYTWTDGLVYNHMNWTGSAPSVSDEDCVEIINAEEGSWGTLGCKMTRYAFLCKRPSNVTSVAVSETTYNYTVGVDRQNVLLLCDPMDSGNLSLLIWSVEGSDTLPNPINIYKMIGDKSIGYYSINCSRDGEEISKTKLIIEVVLLLPQIILQYGDLIIGKVSSVYPVMNNIEIPIGIKNISISNNIEGRWMLPDGSYQFFTLAISTFTSQNNGVYKLYITNWDGLEVCAIQINITVTIDGIEEITNFNIPLQVNYTVGSIIDRLYYSNTEIPDTKIRWTTDTVNDGENMEYSIEYPNPVLLIAVFSNVGAGLHTITSFYRMSPVTSLGNLQLAIKDTVEVTISYEGYTFTTSDISNELFPSPQVISIHQGTKDITLTCTLPECVWMISNEKDTIIASTYSISEIPSNFKETFSLVRSTSSGVEYTTVHISIQTLTEAAANSALLPIIIIVLLSITCIIVATSILVPIFIFLHVKRRRPTKAKVSKRPKPSKSYITGNESNLGYANLSEINPQPKECIDLSSVNTNPEYMTVDETSLTTLDAPTNPNERSYANLSNIQRENIPNQNATKKEKSGYLEMKEELSYENYPSISSVKEERFIAKFIPITEFPTMYGQYVESGIGNDSLFSVEFEKLNEESKKAVVPESREALKEENFQKNPIKNILPFDENRVVLDSTHFDCNFINASWLESYRFIATINPTKETHLDFLQMIYQTEASMVIMLTTRKEKAKILSGISNRVCYWPKKDEPINCGPFVSTLINSTEKNAFVKQEICLKNTLAGKEHSFTQCISPIWNEDGTVNDVVCAIALLNRIMKQKQDSNNVPIIIHCEDGISKTGIIMTVLNSIRELNIRKSINIFNVVKNLRKQRMNNVPTLVSI
ncbi:Receptor-type tyrosine-protein phosphatase C-like [Oopsacas minuta]|uniref:Receptor-type tyrosine-protein phosphatase C-like n=1 Tax=Oopsacas minuta TaxID=111878 RepID=A0AAV7JEE5_9METZ|nr:Receptor-type tyrosine-protein phosphatase C-like [Oopsacas minuta]